MHSASHPGLLMLVCDQAACHYAVSVHSGQQRWSSFAEFRAAAMHRANAGLSGPAGPACLGVPDQALAYLFTSTPYGTAEVRQVLALQPEAAGFPVLANLLHTDQAETVCSQVRLYYGEANAVRSTFCSVHWTCYSCYSGTCRYISQHIEGLMLHT